jgi:nucleoid DNA-binding protein
VNKTEIIHEIHQRMDKKIALKDIDLFVNSLIEIMSEKLKQGEEIQLADFGTFSLAKKTIKSISEK